MEKKSTIDARPNSEIEPEEIKDVDPELLDEALGALTLAAALAPRRLDLTAIRNITTLEIDPGSLISRQYDR